MKTWKILLVIVTLAVAHLALADWKPPASAPPACPAGSPGCDPPIDVSSVDQVKSGGLAIGKNFVVNGISKLLGNVGIGTASPTTLLTLYKNNVSLRFDTNDGGEGKRSATIQTGAVGGSSLALQANGGNLGIGTESPSELLHVVKNSDLKVKFQNTAGAGANVRLLLSTSNSLINDTVGAIVKATRTDSNGSGSTDLVFGTSQGIDMSERMRLTSAGYLGIGTDAPTAKLDITGQIKIRGGGPGANKVLTSDTFGLASWQPAAGGGDITAVNAGDGLSGGGTSGSVTLSADYTKVQKRVSGTCVEGNAIRVIAADGTVTCQAVGAGGISGSGTTNYVTKWTGSSALGKSQIFDNGTNVGIKDTDPDNTLSVGGNVSVGSGYTSGAPTNGMIIQGQVGIGTAAPGEDFQLQVDGATKIKGGLGIWGVSYPVGQIYNISPLDVKVYWPSSSDAGVAHGTFWVEGIDTRYWGSAVTLTVEGQLFWWLSGSGRSYTLQGNARQWNGDYVVLTKVAGTDAKLRMRIGSTAGTTCLGSDCALD